MSAIQVTFPGGKRVDAAFGEHVVRTDQSRPHGGEGAAPEPFDLFLASLATCAGIYVLGFCHARGIETAEIRLAQDAAFEDGKLREVRLTIHLPATFPEKYVNAVRAAAAGCKVKKTLLEPPAVIVDAVRATESRSDEAERGRAEDRRESRGARSTPAPLPVRAG
jgi:putative redox protein